MYILINLYILIYEYSAILSEMPSKRLGCILKVCKLQIKLLLKDGDHRHLLKITRSGEGKAKACISASAMLLDCVVYNIHSPKTKIAHAWLHPEGLCYDRHYITSF